MDSLLNQFTAAKKKRRQDAYSPGGEAGHRPLRATAVYCHKLREIYPEVPIVIGGIEASLRRFAHYDYWSDAVRPSMLAESGADLLVYGMGEKALLAIAADLQQGVEIGNIQDVPGTCYKVPGFDYIWDYLPLASFEEVSEDKKKFAEAYKLEYLEQDALRGRKLAQQNGDICVVQNPPSPPPPAERGKGKGGAYGVSVGVHMRRNQKLLRRQKFFRRRFQGDFHAGSPPFSASSFCTRSKSS